jgi:chromate reductase, NAD(P)H dehydrogenase (quinone)
MLHQRASDMKDHDGIVVLTLCGSIRAKSYNAALVRALPKLAPGGMSFTAAPLIANIPHYDADMQQASGPPAVAAELGQAIREADGVLIASPEYNYSIPGALKNAIDWVSRLPNQPFAGKPVLIQSVSAGAVGGARMQHHLRQVLVFVDALVFARPEVMIGTAAAKFDEAGELTDDTTRDLVRTQLAGFASFVRRLAPR